MNKLNKRVKILLDEKVINPYKKIVQEYSSIIRDKDEIFSLKAMWNKKFNNNNPINLEIGCGSGNFIQKEALNHSNENFIGIEIRFKRIVKSANKSENLKNILFLQTKAENINKIFDNEEISNVHIYFPDPWPKKRHFKNKLLNREFFEKISKILKKDGLVFIKTDHKEYYEDTLKTLENSNQFLILENSQNYYENKELELTATEFEQMFYNKNQNIYFIKIKKKV